MLSDVLGKEPTFLWTFTPTTYGLHHQVDSAVYHCVDLLAKFPGIDAKALVSAERTLADEGVRALASSRPIADHLSGQGFSSVSLWENVADTDLFECAVANSTVIERNSIVFAGNLTTAKVDFRVMIRLAQIPGSQLYIAGPVGEGGGRLPFEVDELRRAGARLLGPLAPGELAGLLARCSVGVIPYSINSYTRGVFPMKVYEYLASGCAVVSTALPSLKHLACGDVELAPSSAAFISAVKVKMDIGRPADVVARRQRVAAKHSWASRTEQAIRLITMSGPNQKEPRA